jgi:hypothetical protein
MVESKLLLESVRLCRYCRKAMSNRIGLCVRCDRRRRELIRSVVELEPRETENKRDIFRVGMN